MITHPLQMGFFSFYFVSNGNYNWAMTLTLKGHNTATLVTAISAIFFWFTSLTTCKVTLQTAHSPRHHKHNPPLLCKKLFHTDRSYFISGPTMNPIRFPRFCNSQEAKLNCLLIRPLWHDRNRCVWAHNRASSTTHIGMYTLHMHSLTKTNMHNHIYTLLSTLLICW